MRGKENPAYAGSTLLTQGMEPIAQKQRLNPAHAGNTTNSSTHCRQCAPSPSTDATCAPVGNWGPSFGEISG